MVNLVRSGGSVGWAAALIAFALASSDVDAAEGALGRPIAGTLVTPNAGVIPSQPVWISNLGQIWLDGSVSGNQQVPIAGQTAVGLDAQVAITLATAVKVWDTGPGSWNFASAATVSYVWTDVTATLESESSAVSRSQSATGLFDLYFTPIVAGYHFSKDEHVALRFNVWAPTGSYEPDRLANTGLNTWTFIPQVAYTKAWPDAGYEFDAVGGLQFYTRNTDTDYQNAPLLTLDLLGLKRFPNGWSGGLIVGTVLQLGEDSGPLADRLDGFVGRDLVAGPMVAFDTRLGGKAPLSVSLRWVPTIYSRNRLDSPGTIMGTLTVAF